MTRTQHPVLIYSTATLFAECIAVRIPPPVRVSGLICGQTFDVTGGPVSGTELYIENGQGLVIGAAQIDAAGKFSFKQLPRGRYKIGSHSGTISFGAIEVSDDRKPACRQPMVVYLGLDSCQGGWISRKWDYHVFPDGPPRTK
jgi:hypothetical protein